MNKDHTTFPGVDQWNNYFCHKASFFLLVNKARTVWWVNVQYVTCTLWSADLRGVPEGSVTSCLWEMMAVLFLLSLWQQLVWEKKTHWCALHCPCCLLENQPHKVTQYIHSVHSLSTLLFKGTYTLIFSFLHHV